MLWSGFEGEVGSSKRYRDWPAQSNCLNRQNYLGRLLAELPAETTSKAPAATAQRIRTVTTKRRSKRPPSRPLFGSGSHGLHADMEVNLLRGPAAAQRPQHEDIGRASHQSGGGGGGGGGAVAIPAYSTSSTPSILR